MSQHPLPATDSLPATAIRIQALPHGRDLPLPSRATPGSAGFDLRAAVSEPVELQPGGFTLVPAGIALELPEGWEAQVRPRSGLAFRYGVTVLNSPGTIDSDYRGEVGVLLINHGKKAFVIERGERIAQLVLARVESVEWQRVSEIDDTNRGDGGFGSSGRH